MSTLNRPKNARLPKTWQSLGARGVNNLASKQLLTTLPPNAPVFRLKANKPVLRKAAQEDIKTELDKALGEVEQSVLDKVEACRDRAKVFEGFKRTTITGNALLHLQKRGSRIIPLERYVVCRDLEGNVLEMIVEDPVAPAALPPEVRKRLREKGAIRGNHGYKKKRLKIYTYLERDGDYFEAYQEVCGERVEDSDARYLVQSSPYIPLRFYPVDEEDYGRSYVEEYVGDLTSLENLAKAVVETAAALARLLIFVNPNGVTKMADVANAPNGQVLVGNAADVTAFVLEKARDHATAVQMADALEKRLEIVFLLNSAVQRDAERVTAEEIRFMAHELDDALGGVYTIQSQEFQLPFVEARMWLMRQEGEVPELPKDIVHPAILTGYDALGRQSDRAKLTRYSATLGQSIGPEKVDRYIVAGEFARRLAIADGIEPDGLVRTEQEVEQGDQQAQLQALLQNLSPEVVKQLGTYLNQQAKPQGATAQ